ncbi:MAG: hypothetical protein HQL05_11420 [Nitrospirae bacterium]|nr:hypothetical protein [Nitrospirota bacterium]
MFEKPLKCTTHDDCIECEDHENTLRNLKREYLSVEDIGTVGYSPLQNMTPQAIAYFLPRIIELALRNQKDTDKTPILVRLIVLLADDINKDRFKLLSNEQVDCILDVLLYIKSHYSDIVENECCSNELNNAIKKCENHTL